jgi:hypothetical protein
MWTADEVAEHFRVHVNTIGKWGDEGIITPCRLSTQTLTGGGSSRKKSPARALFDPRDFEALVSALKKRNFSRGKTAAREDDDAPRPSKRGRRTNVLGGVA